MIVAFMLKNALHTRKMGLKNLLSHLMAKSHIFAVAKVKSFICIMLIKKYSGNCHIHVGIMKELFEWQSMIMDSAVY